MKPKIISGDLLDQKVDVIVNPWHCNIIPWWLLIAQGVLAYPPKTGPLTRLGFPCNSSPQLPEKSNEEEAVYGRADCADAMDDGQWRRYGKRRTDVCVRQLS